MSAKHMRPFYVFAAVAAICAVVLASGLRTSRADHGEQLIAGESPSQAAQPAVRSPAPIDRDRSEPALPGTDEDAPGGDPAAMGSGGAGAGMGGPDATDRLSASGARDVDLRLPEGLELAGPDEDIDLDDPPEDEHGVRGAGEVRSGHHDEQDEQDDKDEDDKDESDDGTDGTGGSGSDGGGDGPMSEDDQPADPDAGGQSTPGPTDPFVPEQQP